MNSRNVVMKLGKVARKATVNLVMQCAMESKEDKLLAARSGPSN